jgi:hypothetical protein
MRVYDAIAKWLQFVGVDAAFGAGANRADLFTLRHSSNVKSVMVADATTDVLRRRKPITMYIGFSALRINDESPIAAPPRTNRDLATFVQCVYLLLNILAIFFAWGVSHA